MDWICEYCGAQMFQWANAGMYFMKCPNENDGKHPTTYSITTNSTPEIDPSAPVTKIATVFQRFRCEPS